MEGSEALRDLIKELIEDEIRNNLVIRVSEPYNYDGSSGLTVKVTVKYKDNVVSEDTFSLPKNGE